MVYFRLLFVVTFAFSLVLFVQQSSAANKDKKQTVYEKHGYDKEPFWVSDDIAEQLAKRYERRFMFFQVLDSNKDWQLDLSEIDRGLMREFKSYDKDQNQILDSKELKKHREDFVKNRYDEGAVIDKRIRRYDLRLRAMDSNENSEVVWEEFYKFWKARYNRMNKNDDKVVEYREFRTIDDKLAPVGSSEAKAVKVIELK